MCTSRQWREAAHSRCGVSCGSWWLSLSAWTPHASLPKSKACWSLFLLSIGRGRVHCRAQPTEDPCPRSLRQSEARGVGVAGSLSTRVPSSRELLGIAFITEITSGQASSIKAMASLSPHCSIHASDIYEEPAVSGCCPRTDKGPQCCVLCGRAPGEGWSSVG